MTMDKLKEARFLLERASWTRNVSGEALDGMLEHATFRSDYRKSFIFRLGGPITHVDTSGRLRQKNH